MSWVPRRAVFRTYFRVRRFFEVADFLAPLCAPGLLAGRIGNFVNQELWGRVSDFHWAMVFPAGGRLPRHSSQLYEAALEGVILFVIVWSFAAKPRRPGQVSGCISYEAVF